MITAELKHRMEQKAQEYREGAKVKFIAEAESYKKNFWAKRQPKYTIENLEEKMNSFLKK